MIKVKYIGTTPIIHLNGYRFEPGKTYELDKEYWALVRSTGRFEIVLPKKKAKKSTSYKYKEKKEEIEEKKEEPEEVIGGSEYDNL